MAKIDECVNIHVTTIDNYQGEENDIILLSLVRSNDAGIVGFLKKENRVCVALSRARNGLYITGNMSQLSAKSSVWKKIKTSLEGMNSLGESIELKCQNHPDSISRIKTGNDIARVSPMGGCRQLCHNPDLECGHKCHRLCHIIDHIDLPCNHQCLKLCEAKLHSCPGKCFQECPPCKAIVIKKLPDCGHQFQVVCSSKIPVCPVKCSKILDCGHDCDKKCHVNDDPNHLIHLCSAPCLRNSKCQNDPPHPCDRLCHEECSTCHHVTTKKAKCGHNVVVDCSQDMAAYVCMHPCKRMMACGHKCLLRCSEPCGACNVISLKKFPDCSHTISVS